MAYSVGTYNDDIFVIQYIGIILYTTKLNGPN